MVPWPLGTREVPIITLQSGLPISHSKLKALRLKTWKDTLLGLKRFSELLPLLSQFLPDFQSGKLSQSPPPPPLLPHTTPFISEKQSSPCWEQQPCWKEQTRPSPQQRPSCAPSPPFPISHALPAGACSSPGVQEAPRQNTCLTSASAVHPGAVLLIVVRGCTPGKVLLGSFASAVKIILVFIVEWEVAGRAGNQGGNSLEEAEERGWLSQAFVLRQSFGNVVGCPGTAPVLPLEVGNADLNLNVRGILFLPKVIWVPNLGKGGGWDGGPRAE